MRLTTTLIALILCTLTLTATAEIYKTKGKDGQTIYTDVPPGKSAPQVVTLPPINSMPATEPANRTSYTDVQAPTVEYQVEIVTPTDGTILTPDQRALQIGVQLAPALENGLILNYQMDGVSLAKTSETSITVPDPFRGERELIVSVEDEEGEVLAQSEPIHVVVVRPMIKQKPKTVPPKTPAAPQ